NFRHLFYIVEMALDSVFNHLTQITQRIGFGRNSMAESGSNKASIDGILCDFKDDFHMSTISQPPIYCKGWLHRASALRFWSCAFWLLRSVLPGASQCNSKATRVLTFHFEIATYFRSAHRPKIGHFSVSGSRLRPLQGLKKLPIGRKRKSRLE